MRELRKESSENSKIERPIEELLGEFSRVFEEPKGLLSIWTCNHGIVLRERAQPNLYPYYQKTEKKKE